ncbi:hypothetical protein [Chitinophaga sp. YIM B06452]|uniref:hypothetical protein n=1 Tax=Chitinophaga sp. YIM B06452 TaxID=3082158 RepID=UPI0031FED86C
MLPTFLTELSVADMSIITGGTAANAEPNLPTLPPVKIDESADLAKAIEEAEEERKKKERPPQAQPHATS